MIGLRKHEDKKFSTLFITASHDSFGSEFLVWLYGLEIYLMKNGANISNKGSSIMSHWSNIHVENEIIMPSTFNVDQYRFQEVAEQWFFARPVHNTDVDFSLHD